MTPPVPTITADPWARREGETDRAFAAFCAFRDAGPKRRTTFQALPAQVNESLAMIYKWSSDWEWSARASAWDDWKDEVGRKAELDELAEVKRRHVRIAGKALNLIEGTLDRMAKSKRDVPASTIPTLLKHSVDITRVALGLHTDHTRTTVDVEEDEDFERLLANPATRALLVAAANGATPVEDDAGSNGATSLPGQVGPS